MAILRDSRHLWPAIWAAIVVVLMGVLALEYRFGRVAIGEGPRSPAKVVEAKLLPPFLLPAEPPSAPETIARPLFVPTRRPSPPAAVAGASTMKKGQFVLTGVTVTPEVSYAFLRESASGKTMSVKKGTQVSGITVESVEPRRVVLKQGEDTEDLTLNVQVPARVAAAPGVPGAVPPAPGSAIGGGLPGAPGMAGAPGSGSAPPRLPGAPGSPMPAPGPGGLPGSGNPAAAAQPAATAPATTRRRPWINN